MLFLLLRANGGYQLQEMRMHDEKYDEAHGHQLLCRQ
jgi:hypothetical protein